MKAADPGVVVTSAPPGRALDGRPPLPLFRVAGGASGGAPLAIISGGLILDLGEAERTFIYRCQDRFLAYSSLWKLPSVFFVAGASHEETYRAHTAIQRERFDRMRSHTGLFSAMPLLEPIYVG